MPALLRPYFRLPRTVHVLCLGALINRAGAFLAPFLTIYLQEKLGFGVGFATRAMGLYGVGALTAFLIGGDLADRIGRRVVMVASLMGGAIILLFFGSLTSRGSIMAALLVFALISEMYRPAASAMIADVTDPQRRPHAYGLMYVAINLGFAVAASLGGYIAQFSFQWLFWGDALTAGVYGTIVLAAVRESLPSRANPRPTASAVHGPSDHRPSEAEPSNHAPAISIVGAARHILADGTFVVFWLGTFCLTLMYMQAFSTFPLYLGSLGIGSAGYGRVIALNGLMIVFLQLPTTSLVTRYHRGTMVVASALVTALGFGLTGVAGTIGQLALTVAIWTCGEMMNAPLSSAIVADLAPTALRARYMGAFSMCFSSAMIVGAPIGGMVLSRFGGGWLWTAAAACGVTAAILYGCIFRGISPHRDRSASRRIPA